MEHPYTSIYWHVKHWWWHRACRFLWSSTQHVTNFPSFYMKCLVVFHHYRPSLLFLSPLSLPTMEDRHNAHNPGTSRRPQWDEAITSLLLWWSINSLFHTLVHTTQSWVSNWNALGSTNTRCHFPRCLSNFPACSGPRSPLCEVLPLGSPWGPPFSGSHWSQPLFPVLFSDYTRTQHPHKRNGILLLQSSVPFLLSGLSLKSCLPFSCYTWPVSSLRPYCSPRSRCFSPTLQLGGEAYCCPPLPGKENTIRKYNTNQSPFKSICWFVYQLIASIYCIIFTVDFVSISVGLVELDGPLLTGGPSSSSSSSCNRFMLCPFTSPKRDLQRR